MFGENTTCSLKREVIGLVLSHGEEERVPALVGKAETKEKGRKSEEDDMEVRQRKSGKDTPKFFG